MAVSGVRVSEPARDAWHDVLMFWGVMYRRVEVLALLRGSWLLAVGAGVATALLLPLLATVRAGAGLYLLLSGLVLVHLGARSWVERRLPDPSFAADLRTGNFEQLRLTPHSAHTLLLQRGVPDLMVRALAMSIWLPLYALVARALGLTLLDTLVLWLLLAFANYFVLGLVAFTLLASAWEGVLIVAGLGLLLYPLMLDNGRMRATTANAGLFGVMIALPIAARLLMPPSWQTVLPDLRVVGVMWLLAELLRVERIARWIGTPSGIWRGYYLLPSAGLMAFVGAFVHQQAEFDGIVGAAQTQLKAIGVFAAAGYLNLVLLTLRRHAEPAVQPLRAHLVETGLLRLLSVGVIGGGLSWWSLPKGSALFWGVLAWLTAVEWLVGAWIRRALQQAHSRAPRLAYGVLLVGLLPALAYWVHSPVLSSLPTVLSAFSPTFALVLASDAHARIHTLTAPLLVMILGAPIVRYGALLALLRLGVALQWATERPSWRSLRWLALPLLYPLFDWYAHRQARNPLSQLVMTERQPPFAPLLGVSAAILTLYNPSARQALFFGLLVLLGVFLWLWGYYTTAKRVRRWIASGELTSAILAGLTPQQFYWGWVHGAWYHQMRILIAVISGALLGWLIEVGYALSSHSWGRYPPGVIAFFVVIPGGMFLILMALWACAWLIAAPAAVRDQLQQWHTTAPTLTPRTALMALFASLLGCCAPLAPLLLVALPVYTTQSMVMLSKLARAPMEPPR